MQLQENDLARRNFERAISLTPNDSEVQNNYGWFLCQTGQPKEAIAHFRAALKNPLYGTPEKPNLNAGICSLKLGDKEAAEEYFKKAIQLQPNTTPALYYLGELYFKRADFAQAKGYIDRYIQLMAEPSAEALWLAIRIARMGGDRHAEAQYNFMLRKRYPDSKEVQLLREGRYE
jgi:type IV pilus assembly protein PilF